MRQMLCPVLVGREEELQVLLDALDQAADGRGRTVFVEGEAGVGKSRLVQEVSRRAHSRGLPVLAGRAVPGSVPVAFRPLAEAVLGELRRRGQMDVPELRPLRPVLGGLVPEWRPREPAPGVESPVVLGEGLLRLLGVLAGGRFVHAGGSAAPWADLHSGNSEGFEEAVADNDPAVGDDGS